MSAERLAVGDLVRCSRCHKWHPAEIWASGSATDYAEKMLFIRCGTAHFFVGTIDGRARDPKAVKSPLELELWRVRNDGRTISCELRCDANGWDVLIRDNGEPVFSRRCASEDEARLVANGLKEDELKTGGADAVHQNAPEKDV